MSLSLKQILSTTRAIVIDQLEDGVDPAFTDNQIIEAANVAKDDFFGMRPEAFSKTDIATEAPSDLADRQSLSFGGFTKVTFPNFDSSVGAVMADGSLHFDFKASLLGTLFYAGNGSTLYLTVQVSATGLDLLISDDDGVGGFNTLTLSVLGSFLDSQWRHVDISFLSGTTTVVVDYDNEAEDSIYADNFIPDTTNTYFGAPATGIADLVGSVDALVFRDAAGDLKALFEFDEGAGTVVVDSVAAINGTVTNPVWVEGDELVMANWAHRLYLFGVASFLLSQRGKDSYYRKAADATRKLYLGG